MRRMIKFTLGIKNQQMSWIGDRRGYKREQKTANENEQFIYAYKGDNMSQTEI